MIMTSPLAVWLYIHKRPNFLPLLSMMKQSDMDVGILCTNGNEGPSLDRLNARSTRNRARATMPIAWLVIGIHLLSWLLRLVNASRVSRVVHYLLYFLIVRLGQSIWSFLLLRFKRSYLLRDRTMIEQWSHFSRAGRIIATLRRQKWQHLFIAHICIKLGLIIINIGMVWGENMLLKLLHAIIIHFKHKVKFKRHT